MKILIIIILLLLIVAVYYLVPLARSIAISKKIEAQTKPFAQFNEKAQFKILVAGDSTVYGTGAQKPQNSIAGRFAQDYPESEIINISENGLKIEELRKKLETHLQKRSYDYIHIQIGANDIISLSRYGDIEESLVDLIDLVSKKSEFVTVLTAADIGDAKIFKYPLSRFVSERTRVIRQIFIDTIAEYKNVQYIDLYSRKAMLDRFAKNPTKYYARDNFHPSDAGYGEWYEAITETLQK